MMSFRERLHVLNVTGEDILGFHSVPSRQTGNSEALVRCPQPDHEDLHPSCSVNLASGQFYCFSCGRFGDRVDLHRLLGGWPSVSAALEDLERLKGASFPAPPIASASTRSGRRSSQPKSPGEPFVANRWHYVEADGTPAFDVIRLEYQLSNGDLARDPKTGKPLKDYRPTLPGGRKRGLPGRYSNGQLRPLLYLPEILDASRNEVIWVVEGEPAADALRATDRIATTSSSGSSSARKTNWEPLAGRRVVIWPDNDAPGRRYADLVTGILRELSPQAQVRVLQTLPKSLPSGGDAVDWLRRRSHATCFTGFTELSGRGETS